MRSNHTSPVPGQKPIPKKAGFKVRSDKDYSCKLGKRLIRDKILIPMEENTWEEFTNFGKDKKKWKGIASHDDLAMAELNISRFWEETAEIQSWFYDLFENLPDTPAKRYAAQILETLAEDGDIDDGMWNALYEDAELTEQERLNKIFQNESESHARSAYKLGTFGIIKEQQN